MQIALFIRALKAWWQHAWRSTVRTFHLFIAFLFFVFALLAGQKAFRAWQDYGEHPEKGEHEPAKPDALHSTGNKELLGGNHFKTRRTRIIAEAILWNSCES